ncbi:hypothetical protein BH10ACT7_BH10ACT7_24500 [soil metagenome]
MAVTMKQIVQRHGAFVSAVTAAAVGLVIVVTRILTALITVLGVLPYLDQISSDPWGWGLRDAFLTGIPFALGFFISLWIIAPIAEELRIGHVITRAVLATGVGSSVLFVVLAIMAIAGAFTFGQPMFGNSFQPPGFDTTYVLTGLSGALQGALLAFVGLLPLGVLAGVLLWLWRKDNPPKKPLAGLIDEV